MTSTVHFGQAKNIIVVIMAWDSDIHFQLCAGHQLIIKSLMKALGQTVSSQFFQCETVKPQASVHSESNRSSIQRGMNQYASAARGMSWSMNKFKSRISNRQRFGIIISIGNSKFWNPLWITNQIPSLGKEKGITFADINWCAAQLLQTAGTTAMIHMTMAEEDVPDSGWIKANLMNVVNHLKFKRI